MAKKREMDKLDTFTDGALNIYEQLFINIHSVQEKQSPGRQRSLNLRNHNIM